jgi:4-hydroxybenzoate polyprenyltransferase
MKKNNIGHYIELSRILKPTGFMLLWIPCLWGLALQDLSLYRFLSESFIYFIGAVSLRTFGCIVNDIFDKDFDKNVERTKNRPLASYALTVKQAFMFGLVSLIPGICVFLYLNFESKLIALLGFFISIIYPLFKRFTHFPQLILGFAFNIGVVISAFDRANLSTIIWLYIAGVFWTLAYDTIYAFQDEKDDAIIGVKSTARYFKNYPKITISLFYFMMLTSFFTAFYNGADFFKIILLLLIMYAYLFIQIKKWTVQSTKSCHIFFKQNVLIGLILTIIIFMLARS